MRNGEFKGAGRLPLDKYTMGTIGLVEAMGFDRNCIGSTTDLTCDTMVGFKGINPKVIKPFGNRVHAFPRGTSKRQRMWRHGGSMHYDT